MTEEIAALRQSIAGVLADMCGGRAVHRHVAGEAALDRALHTQAAGLGWLGIGVAEDHGGVGAGLAGSAMLIGELARVAAPGSFLPTVAVAHVVERFCEPTMREGLLAGIVAGKVTGAIAARPDDADHGDTVLGDRSGQRLLLGAFGGVGLALWRCEDAADALAIWDMTRTLWTVPSDAQKLCDLPGEAAACLKSVTSLLIAADCVGLAQGIFDRTVAYLNEREQFGVRIGSFQALKHRAADMAAELAMLEAMLGHAVAALEADDAEAAFWSAGCKASASDTAVAIASDCLQLHGGIGFTWEHDCHLFLKRARLNQMLGADNVAMRLRAFEALAARALAGERRGQVMA
ncbi:MAG TPA: acyl-CoA dehydrogenase family protein [Novosphingobium sp.]|nr:acyl-CoA dehydrogenase family protein [Novosphingobium sp.]